MSFSLRTLWVERLKKAQTESSWQAQTEARVLRFLLARYQGGAAATPLAPFPLQEGESPRGRTHLPLTGRQIGEILQHIAKINAKRPRFLFSLFGWDATAYWDAIAYQDVKRRRSEQAARRFEEERRERFKKRRGRGYW